MKTFTRHSIIVYENDQKDAFAAREADLGTKYINKKGRDELNVLIDAYNNTGEIDGKDKERYWYLKVRDELNKDAFWKELKRIARRPDKIAEIEEIEKSWALRSKYSHLTADEVFFVTHAGIQKIDKAINARRYDDDYLYYYGKIWGVAVYNEYLSSVAKEVREEKVSLQKLVVEVLKCARAADDPRNADLIVWTLKELESTGVFEACIESDQLRVIESLGLWVKDQYVMKKPRLTMTEDIFHALLKHLNEHSSKDEKNKANFLHVVYEGTGARWGENKIIWGSIYGLKRDYIWPECLMDCFNPTTYGFYVKYDLEFMLSFFDDKTYYFAMQHLVKKMKIARVYSKTGDFDYQMEALKHSQELISREKKYAESQKLHPYMAMLRQVRTEFLERWIKYLDKFDERIVYMKIDCIASLARYLWAEKATGKLIVSMSDASRFAEYIDEVYADIKQGSLSLAERHEFVFYKSVIQRVIGMKHDETTHIDKKCFKTLRKMASGEFIEEYQAWLLIRSFGFLSKFNAELRFGFDEAKKIVFVRTEELIAGMVIMARRKDINNEQNVLLCKNYAFVIRRLGSKDLVARFDRMIDLFVFEYAEGMMKKTQGVIGDGKMVGIASTQEEKLLVVLSIGKQISHMNPIKKYREKNDVVNLQAWCGKAINHFGSRLMEYSFNKEIEMMDDKLSDYVRCAGLLDLSRDEASAIDRLKPMVIESGHADVEKIPGVKPSEITLVASSLLLKAILDLFVSLHEGASIMKNAAADYAIRKAVQEQFHKDFKEKVVSYKDNFIAGFAMQTRYRVTFFNGGFNLGANMIDRGLSKAPEMLTM